MGTTEEKRLSKQLKLIKRPELITVQTLKKKMADQIPQLRKEDERWNWWDLEWIGIFEGYKLLVRTPTNTLYWIHRMDYVQWKTADFKTGEQYESFKEAQEEAWNEIERFPQLFTM